MNNPCRQCDIFLSGNGYDDDHCFNCKKRLAYVGAIGPMTHSMPVDMMHIGRSRDAKTPAEKVLPALPDPPATKKEIIVENPKTKVCSKKDCKHEGRPQPLDEFDNCRANRDGKASHCKSCRRKYQRAISKRKKQAKSDAATKKHTAPSPETKKKVQSDMKPAPAPAMDWLDHLFDGRSDLLDKLTAMAEAKMRTPKKQLLYMVQSAPYYIQAQVGYIGIHRAVAGPLEPHRAAGFVHAGGQGGHLMDLNRRCPGTNGPVSVPSPSSGLPEV